MKSRRLIATIAILLILGSSLPATDVSGSPKDGPPDESLDLPENPRRTLLVNSLLPGTAQIALGQEKSGRRLLASSLALSLAGASLIAWDFAEYFSENSQGFGVYRQDNRTYLLPPGENEGLLQGTWRMNTGLLLSTWGTALAAYSQWAAIRELLDRGAGAQVGFEPPRTGYESFGSLLVAPYRAEHVLSWDVFPFFPMTIVVALDWDDLEQYADFFTRDTVDFWGLDVSPWAGLALNSVFAFAFVHANATAEEILYRGIDLETDGVVLSSVRFGAAHLPNMVLPGVSVEDTILQTVFATLFGLYAGRRTVENGYDFRSMIALHFWHNIAALTLSYLEQPADPAFAWTISLRF